MQRKKKIEKADNLKNNARLKIEGSHVQRFQNLLKGLGKSEETEFFKHQILVSKNGSFKLQEKGIIIKGFLEIGEPVILMANVETSEKAVNLVEIVKNLTGISNKNVNISLSVEGDIKIVIRPF